MAARAVHGHACTGKRSGTYISWQSMLRRVRNPDAAGARYYRHVTVCERWLLFDNFLEDMGERPENCTLDRIDPSGNYEPSNCRWTDWSTQIRNRRGPSHTRPTRSKWAGLLGD